jgi:hypothetical protein
MAETTVSGAVEALEAQTAELIGLKAKFARLEAENVRLAAALSAPALAPPASAPVTSRRGMPRQP